MEKWRNEGKKNYMSPWSKENQSKLCKGLYLPVFYIDLSNFYFLKFIFILFAIETQKMNVTGVQVQHERRPQSFGGNFDPPDFIWYTLGILLSNARAYFPVLCIPTGNEAPGVVMGWMTPVTNLSNGWLYGTI